MRHATESIFPERLPHQLRTRLYVDRSLQNFLSREKEESCVSRVSRRKEEYFRIHLWHICVKFYKILRSSHVSIFGRYALMKPQLVGSWKETEILEIRASRTLILFIFLLFPYVSMKHYK